ncbi:MAG TPA: PKD domain-containing protein, partial [Bacteroidia bacterium]|nr:PKD domain-containing protein [Bacteroidia bacterium]
SKTYGSPAMGQYQFSAPSVFSCVVGNTVYITSDQYDGTHSDILLIAMDLDGKVACSPGTSLNVVQSTNSPSTTACNMTFSQPNLAYVPATGSGTRTFPDPCSAYHVDLGPDTSSCSAFLLDAGNPGATYQWQDGSTQQTFTADGAGIYWVNVTINCCWITDSITVSYGTPLATLGGNAFICDGQEASLTASGGTSYSWSTGDTTATISIDTPGTYSVVVSNQCGSDTLFSEVQSSSVTAAFAPGGNLAGGSFTAAFTDSSTNAVSWLWDFGDAAGSESSLQNPDFTYSADGCYPVTLTVTNDAGCMDTAVQGKGGKLCQIHTYVWKLSVTDVRGEEHNLIGQVNLIR